MSDNLLLGDAHCLLKGAVCLTQLALDRGNDSRLVSHVARLRSDICLTSGLLAKTPASGYFNRALHRSVRVSLDTAETLLGTAALRLSSLVRMENSNAK